MTYLENCILLTVLEGMLQIVFYIGTYQSVVKKGFATRFVGFFSRGNFFNLDIRYLFCKL